MAAELFARRTGVTLHHSQYRDTRQLYADLLAGRIGLSFNNVMSMLPLIRERRLVPLGNTGPQPHPALPDVPPIASAGLSGYAVNNWLGVVGPADLRPGAVAEIGAALAAAAHKAATNAASDIATSTAEAFEALLRREWERWTPIVRELGWARRLG